MDEYVGNDWPGYSKPMPKHGHKWINILQKERGQVPMIDIAYVPTMCNHCDNAPCIEKAGGAKTVMTKYAPASAKPLLEKSDGVMLRLENEFPLWTMPFLSARPESRR
jgi:hypothetical protein